MEELLNIDKSLFFSVNHGWASPILDPLMVVLSSRITWSVFFSSLLVFFIWTKQKRHVLLMLYVGASVALLDKILSYGLKPFFARLRPCRAYADEVFSIVGCAGKFGFPSNHAANAMVIATFAILLCTRSLGIAAMVMALLVGISRLYLGAHYPLDVIGGFLFGAPWALISFAILRKIKYFELERTNM